MKRIIATTNKRKSLSAFARQLKNTVYVDPKYICDVNLDENTVDVYVKSKDSKDPKIIIRYTLDTVEDEVKRYRYRRATDADISAGVPLFVKEPYTASVNKQVPSAQRVDSIASRHE